jgi:peptidyl-prolyl cis-trans isomerase C
MSRAFLTISLISLLTLASVACGGSQADLEPDQAASGLLEPAAGSTELGLDAVGTPPAPATAGGTVATVNGIGISTTSLDEAIDAFLLAQRIPSPPPPDRAATIRSLVLDALIGRELIFQLSAKEGIEPTLGEIEEVFNQTRAEFPDDETWQNQLAQRGTTDAELRALVKRNLAIDKLIQDRVVAKIEIGEEEIRQYYDQNPQEMQRPEEVRTSHILVKVPPGAGEDDKAPVRARAAELLAKVRAGQDFATLARENSEDTGSAVNGGDLGFIRRGTTVPSFEAAAFALAVNTISDVVESDFGYHIIKVTDRHEAGSIPFEEVSEPLKRFLVQRKARDDMQTFVKILRDQAQVEVF